MVITNKKIIQQARSQTIAKVVQKLRKVKDALGKKPDNEVNKARQRKNVEYIAELKSLKLVDIMRSLLLKDEKKHKAVLTNGRATPDEVAIAMLGLNKVMQGLVAKFQETLNLSSDANAKWREEIVETSKRRLKLERTEEKRRKRKELKELKAQSRNRLEWLEKNKPEGEAPESDVKLITTVAGVCQVETVKNVSRPAIKADAISSGNGKPKKSDKKPKVQKSQESKQKVTPKRVEKNQKTQEKLIKSEPEIKYEHKKPKEEEKDRPTHVVDPFFITESGQPYLSTAVVMSDDNNESDDNDAFEWEQKRRKPMNKRQEINRTRINENPIKSNFVGKKTKFAEDGSAAETILPTLPPPADTESSNAGMHPSWIAKQKLKPKIAAFAGTKIKFDD